MVRIYGSLKLLKDLVLLFRTFLNEGSKFIFIGPDDHRVLPAGEKVANEWLIHVWRVNP
jgi:hypothetical protein